jgi:hypothetical protein
MQLKKLLYDFKFDKGIGLTIAKALVEAHGSKDNVNN